MARPTNTTGYPPKSIYRTPLTTDGQHLVVSTGAEVDAYGKMNIKGSMDYNTVEHTSRVGALPTTVGAGFGIKIFRSTDDHSFYIPAPTRTGDELKLVVVTSTFADGKDNAVTQFIVKTPGYFYSSGRTISITTAAVYKRGKTVTLTGTTGVFVGKKSWVVTNIYPVSSGAPMGLTGGYTLSDSTAE